MDKERFNAVFNAYKAMYYGAKNDKERKGSVNSFRAGKIKISKR